MSLRGVSKDEIIAIWLKRAQRAPSPIMGTLREMYEELGITRDEIVDIRLVAIYRSLYWGGKPQALFVASTNENWEKIKQDFSAGLEEHGKLNILFV